MYNVYTRSKKGFTLRNRDSIWNPCTLLLVVCGLRVMLHGTRRYISSGTERLSRWRTVRKNRSRVKILKVLKLLIFRPVATGFAARCSTCVQIVATYVNVESSVETFLQIIKQEAHGLA